MGAKQNRTRRVLIIVENLPVPFDRRVWHEATTLKAAGYEVSVICPKGFNATASFEMLEGVAIYRHPLPFEARGPAGYVIEYGSAIFWEMFLASKIYLTRGFDVIHACNPPDLIFLVASIFKLLFGTRFIFDHHDINPELYEAKFARRDFFYRLLCALERATFRLADVSIATNNSYRAIAIERGRMPPERVFVVRSGPSLKRMRIMPPNNILKKGRSFLVGYVGVMGAQEGIDYLLEAARIIVHDMKRKDVQFGLVGGGPELEEMKKRALQLEIGDFITFTGRVPDDVMLEVLNTADVCVNPDECNVMNDKSTMNKIIEYMALGKPIVQFDLTEGRYSAGEASLYANCNDAADFAQKIMQLLEDPFLRDRMGKLGRERIIAGLTWEHEVPNLLAAYSVALA